jgi:hypothetical protein
MLSLKPDVIRATFSIISKYKTQSSNLYLLRKIRVTGSSLYV